MVLFALFAPIRLDDPFGGDTPLPPRRSLSGRGVAALLLSVPLAAQAQSLGLCERSHAVSAGDQDLILRFTATVMRELARDGANIALVSRAGTDLRRFGIRYSHAGLALKDNPEGPWSVRQLYYVCDESRPRLFDQGLAAFLLAGKATGPIFVSIVTWPADADADAGGGVASGSGRWQSGEALHDRALDKATALRLLSDRYSANAYAYGLRYQNCNQWVAEMLAAAWDPHSQPQVKTQAPGTGTRQGQGQGPVPVPVSTPRYDRAQAQAWLRSQDYQPTDVQVRSHGLMFIGQWVPLLHMDDHPLDDLYALRMRVSLPDSLERFVRQQAPGAQRVELCLNERRVVVHRGWTPLGDDCQPVHPDDEVQTLD